MMRKFAILLLITVLSSIASTAQSFEEIYKDSTVLWKISGNGLEKPSYLMGTFHLLCKAQYTLPNHVDSLLKQADDLVVEVDMFDLKNMQNTQKLLRSEVKITDQLDEADELQLDSLLQLKGHTLAEVDDYSMLGLMSLLMESEKMCDKGDTYMLDVDLMLKAFKQKKSIQGLETIQQQSDFFNEAYTIHDVIKELKTSTSEAGMMDQLMEAYIQGKLGLLDSMMANYEGFDSKQTEILLHRRNANWMEVLPKIMSKASVFIAVGAGHLTGEKGLLFLLKSQGYQLTPVYKNSEGF